MIHIVYGLDRIDMNTVAVRKDDAQGEVIVGAYIERDYVWRDDAGRWWSARGVPDGSVIVTDMSCDDAALFAGKIAVSTGVSGFDRGRGAIVTHDRSDAKAVQLFEEGGFVGCDLAVCARNLRQGAEYRLSHGGRLSEPAPEVVRAKDRVQSLCDLFGAGVQYVDPAAQGNGVVVGQSHTCPLDRDFGDIHDGVDLDATPVGIDIRQCAEQSELRPDREVHGGVLLFVPIVDVAFDGGVDTQPAPELRFGHDFAVAGDDFAHSANPVRVEMAGGFVKTEQRVATMRAAKAYQAHGAGKVTCEHGRHYRIRGAVWGAICRAVNGQACDAGPRRGRSFEPQFSCIRNVHIDVGVVPARDCAGKYQGRKIDEVHEYTKKLSRNRLISASGWASVNPAVGKIRLPGLAPCPSYAF